MVDMKTGAALKGIRVVAPIPGIGLYGQAVTQDPLAVPSARWVAARQTPTSGLRRVIWKHDHRYLRGTSCYLCGNQRLHRT